MPEATGEYEPKRNASIELEELLLEIPIAGVPYMLFDHLGVTGPTIGGRHIAVQAVLVLVAVGIALVWINVSMNVAERLAALRRGLSLSEYKLRKRKSEIEQQQQEARRDVEGAIRTIKAYTNGPYYDGEVHEEDGVTRIEIEEGDGVEVLERSRTDGI